MHCPYEQNRRELDGNCLAQCMVVSVATGFTVTVASDCKHCISNQFWNDANVPQLKADAQPRRPSEAVAMKLVQDSPFFASIYELALKSRIIAGDSPRYQASNPVDMDAAFTKFRTTHGDQAAKDLLATTLERRLAQATEKTPGCDSQAVARDKVVALAEKHGLMTSAKAESLRREELNHE